MPIRIVRRSYSFVRVDAVSVIAAPLFGTVIMIVIGKLAIASGVVTSFYASPFIMLAALVSNRVCLRSGLLAAALGVVAHEFFFSAPYNHLDWPSPEQALSYSFSFIAAYGCARRTSLPPIAKYPAETGSLPFTADDTTRERRFWVIESTDDWSDDCTVGAEYARIYVDKLRSNNACPPLGWIVRDMIKIGKFTGVEAGFFSSITRIASGEVLVEPRRLLADQDSQEIDGDTAVIKP